MKKSRQKSKALRLPWKKRNAPRQEAPPKPISAFGGLKDSKVLRHHAVRALCGVLMDRHGDCRAEHPFCNQQGHRKNGDTPTLLIAEAVGQRGAVSTPEYDNVIGIYLTRAMSAASNASGETDIVQYIARMVPLDPAPSRKIVVYPPKDSIYSVWYGGILNPVAGDYSTGRIDPAMQRFFTCDPEPSHCEWGYWESTVSADVPTGTWPVLRFHCLQIFGKWWIVEVNQNDGRTQMVATLDFADNPNHHRETLLMSLLNAEQED